MDMDVKPEIKASQIAFISSRLIPPNLGGQTVDVSGPVFSRDYVETMHVT